MTVIRENPFGQIINQFYQELTNTKFEFPFLPQIIKYIILAVIIFLNLIFYITFGIFSQISGLLYDLMIECASKIKDENVTLESKMIGFVSASGYSIAFVVYQLLFIPIWIIQSPILLLGAIYHKSKVLFIIFLISIKLISLLFTNGIIYIDFLKGRVGSLYIENQNIKIFSQKLDGNGKVVLNSLYEFSTKNDLYIRFKDQMIIVNYRQNQTLIPLCVLFSYKSDNGEIFAVDVLNIIKSIYVNKDNLVKYLEKIAAYDENKKNNFIDVAIKDGSSIDKIDAIILQLQEIIKFTKL
jgi:hypothetical protein